MARILLTAALRITFFAIIAIAVVACSSGTSKTSSTSMHRTATHTTGSARDVSASLKLTMDHVGDKSQPAVPPPTRLTCTKNLPATCSGTLNCPAANGSEDARCGWLATHADDLVDHGTTGSSGRACTQQYGGPATVTVTGTVNGTSVDAHFSRQDGCAINDWDTYKPLWTD